MIHSKSKFLLQLGLLALLLTPLAFQATPAVADQGASGWHIETVDRGLGSYSGYISLALDEGGYPHISYHDAINRDLKYAYQDISGWHIETVDSEGKVGAYTSLALDEAGYPHISYFDCGTAPSRCDVGDLKYAYRDASGWHTETVDSYGFAGKHTSLALDGDGYPHIGYYYGHGTGDMGLKYAFQDASGWHTEAVDPELWYNSGYISLALDGGDYPHISYFYDGNGDLKYAYQDASGWHIETVDNAGWYGGHTSLALDGDGYPHISYYDRHPDYYGLKYAYQDASGWHIEIVDSEGIVGEYTSLALDESGYPHISYHDWLKQDLKYAYQDVSGWHIETVDSEAQVGKYTCLALDGNGYPHISYYDSTNGNLKYAYYRPPNQVYLPIILKE